MRTADTAQRLRDAAFELFQAQGFDATTVEDIAQRAAVGRTTFFRHFRAKEDVVFPDHAALAAAVAARLDASTGEPPVVAVTEAALLVLDRYVEEGQRARARYRLVTSVEPLRARELASTQPYQRAFGRYLRQVLADDPEGLLQAEVVAAAVIAAHNVVLRRWLREDSGDPRRELREVLAEVFRRWSWPGAPAASLPAGPSSGSAVVVVSSDLPAEEAAAVVRRALEEGARTRVGGGSGR
jgi:AcrR family transcriptional regulator